MSAHKKQVGGDHYKRMAIQPSHYIVKNKLGWYEGNIIKSPSFVLIFFILDKAW